MRLDGRVIAAVTGASVEGSASSFEGFSIDTRTISPGELFFALRGPNFDGHSFVSDALAKGGGAVVAWSYELSAEQTSSGPLFRVEDPFEALRAVARHVRDTVNPRVVGITGSVGKTTTKEMTAAVLGRKFEVHRTEGNLNNTIGLPLVLARMPEKTEAAVIEMGMSFAGEISTLTRLARPDVGVVTAVAPVHLMNFDSIEGIKEAKAEILEGMGPGSTFVANADDSRVEEIARRHPGRVVRYSASANEADVFLSGFEERMSGSRVSLRVFGESVIVELPLPGRHNALNFLAAAAIGAVLGVPAKELEGAARSLRPAAHRSQVTELGSGVLLYDDCYNSSPSAVRAAFAAFEGLARDRRRVAVLGEMLELGSSSPVLHRELGRDLAGRVDLLIAVRGDAREFVAGLKESGAPGEAVLTADADEAATCLLSVLRPGDAVFVKGSRGVRLDRVVDKLTGGVG